MPKTSNMKFFCFCLCICGLLTSYAQPYGGDRNNIDIENRSAGCAPSTSSTYLELNNVKALIHTAGNLWQIAGKNYCHYEIPKGSGIMALFTSSLWMAGTDVNGQLKIAALRYRNGDDYWNGPLTQDAAEIIPDQCLAYDKHFVISKEEVSLFNSWFEAGIQDDLNGTNTQTTNFEKYAIPRSILDWPAHGDQSLGHPYYMAPFFDRNNDGIYNPEDHGDYPYYDLNKDIDCRNSRVVTLFGDQTLWWVMNDKGNIHTETNGEPLGMEIRAQAFAFATNNEVNDMTFYNYELINRSTQTLYNTYFGLMVDVALGGPNDDYVGCDVSRGLGYSYNGDNDDESESGFKGYGSNPPAVGVDFFEGPYQDDDNIDNPLTENVTVAISQKGIPYEGLGIGYNDGILDNERFGMRRFLYYNNTGQSGNIYQTDPQDAVDYYAYLTGYWKDGSPFAYGGTGHLSDPDANTSVKADFMFPGNSDPLGWGTQGVTYPNWTEETSNNIAGDRRFAQCAGPFTLKPGAVNNITVGVVWARSGSGSPFQSVNKLLVADDKAQALFDNCFEVLEGPHAPDIIINELENELVITLYNPINSNNATENYQERDPEIIFDDKTYRFQGYQVFQLKSSTISSNELHDISKARLVFQSDIKDGIGTLINYTFSLDINASVPSVEVQGKDNGILHSFSVKEDLFAIGDRTLVNFKKYHYMAISYAHNNYKTYEVDVPGNTDGQKKPYLASRKATFGQVRPYTGIPHKTEPQNGGTLLYESYGYEIPLTQVDGWGNGGNWTNINAATTADILAHNSVDKLTFESGSSPIKIKVIDPLNVPSAEFQFKMTEDIDGKLYKANWVLINLTTNDSIFSNTTIDVLNEQLIPEWGISVTLRQIIYGNDNLLDNEKLTTPIGAKMTFDDPSKIWFTGISDTELDFPTNWIRSGDNDDPSNNLCFEPAITNPCYYADFKNLDNPQLFEDLLDGIVAPFRLVGNQYAGMPLGSPGANYNDTSYTGAYFYAPSAQVKSYFVDLHGIDILITDDKSKWTRCPVIELNINESLTVGGADIMELRKSPSLDIDGNQESSTGMSWFPGYAIDVETGQRLNMAFGENSWFKGANGADMLWNPHHEITSDLGVPPLGGQHFIYVFGANDNMPVYDEGKWMYEKLSADIPDTQKGVNFNKTWSSCRWVIEPVLVKGHRNLETDVHIQLRVKHPYQKRTATNTNNSLPAYTFNTLSIATETNRNDVAVDALRFINIVPNPYYAFSKYEESRLDNRVKITNLPENCTIRIFTVSGQLIKSFEKSAAVTYIDWDLTNHKNIPITSGVYIIHVDVPGVGTKILKWFGTMRKVDLNNI